MSNADTSRRTGLEGPEVFVKPAPGCTVPRPDGTAWTDTAGAIHGDWLNEDQYVRRRLADEDLVLADPAFAAKAAKQVEAARQADPAPETEKKVK